MSKKRRDKKGRVLRDGERQRPDGRYEYRYTDSNGKTRSVYSWKLVETDTAPSGKRKSVALREQEKAIQECGHTVYKTCTLNDLFERSLETKSGLRPHTRTMYRSLYDNHIRYGLGRRQVSDIKFSDIVRSYTEMSRGGLSDGTIHAVHSIIGQAFRLAELDELIERNPTRSAYAEFLGRRQPHKKKVCALTIEQQQALVRYLRNNNRYERQSLLVLFMLGTGCRVGEAVGITWSDCNFERNTITVERQLKHFGRGEKNPGLHVVAPKTENGNRKIPMLPEIRDLLLAEKERQERDGQCSISVDGVSGFVFFTQNGKLFSFDMVNDALKRIINACNESEGYEILPIFASHTLRHTFCTRLCENDTNTKVIQSVMGHSSISVTMDIYAEVTAEKKATSFAELGGRMCL